MAYTISKRVKRAFYRLVLRRAYRDLLEEEFVRRVVKAVTAAHGEFLDGRNFSAETVTGLPSESAMILGEVVHALRAVARPDKVLLLAGERNSSKPAYSRISGIPDRQIFTAGLHDEMDYRWNYDLAAPDELPQADLIASHAMLEHIMDPYLHLSSCYRLLNPGGYAIFHTVMPGFQYHRHPVDCLRFYPDWFEVAAERLGAKVVMRLISTEAHIVYCLQKPDSDSQQTRPPTSSHGDDTA
jgi:SAM-dependent methyltransferase